MKYGGPVAPYCCHNSGGCSTAQCSSFPWYSYCRATACCWDYGKENTLYPGTCSLGDYYSGIGCVDTPTINFSYSYTVCSAVDSCETGPKLKCGLCLESGACGKCSGYYKVCCSSTTNGIYPDDCTGGNHSGVCHSGCYPLIAGSCPGGGGACNGVCSISADCALKA